jgi:peptidoglycan hydrolase CwlO-like protein
MAGKTSSSVGVGVAVTLLSVTTLGLFVTTAIYFGKYNSQKEEFNKLKNETDQFIKTNERQDGEVQALTADARKSGKSLVAYMRSRVGGVMKATTGVENTKFDDFDSQVKKLLGGEGGTLVGAVSARDSQITSLKEEATAADKARTEAIADLEKTRTQVEITQKALIEENDKLKTQIAGYESELKKFNEGIVGAEEKFAENIRNLEADAAGRIKVLDAKISSLERENLVIVEQLAKLRGQQAGEILKAKGEEALVDAEVVGVSADGKQVIISVGSDKKVPLGITFAVYSDASQIAIDERTGEYRRGKATLEVINVGSTTSTCRVNSATKGSPVVQGDVIANAVYDPNKTYKFVVYGNFDGNGDGVATPIERADIIAMVEGWGGKVINELAGDVDFLILGEKPILPPRPSDGSPFEVLQNYVKLQAEVAKYDEFYKSAQSTSVPILNQNRFMTLIGAKPVRAR